MLPSPAAITAEMERTGLAEMQAIRRIQQREILRRRAQTPFRRPWAGENV